MTAEGERNHGGLNGTRLLEAEIANAFEQTRIEAERRERNRRGVARDRFERRRARLRVMLRLRVVGS